MDLETKYPELFVLVKLPEDGVTVFGASLHDFTNCFTATHPDAALYEKDVVAAIIHVRGNYAAIARLLNRSRRVVHTYITRNNLLRDLRDDVRQTVLDDIEDQYMQDAMNGDKEARKFFLRTLARDRGYSERNEMSGPDGGPVSLESRIDFTKVPDSALEAIVNASKGAEG